MNNILIAIDYDPTARKVAETGYELGKALKANVTLLHVVSNEVYYSTRAYTPIMGFAGFSPTEPVEGEIMEHIKEAAYAYLDKTRNHLGNNDIQTIVKEGDFAETILETVRLINADVIVMGSHSRRWLEKIVMGSVTEKVLQSTEVPLLVVPTMKKDKES